MKIKCDVTVRNFKTVELEIPDNIDLMNKYEKQKYFSGHIGSVNQEEAWCKTELNPHPVAEAAFFNIPCMICGKYVPAKDIYQQYAVCDECKDAIECVRRYEMSEAIDLAAEKIYQDTKNLEIK